MVTVAKNHSGSRFGKWVVISRAPNRASKRTVWNCRCDCGTEKEVATCHLVSGASTNCGCTRPARTRAMRVIHGATKTDVYEIWCGMKARCSNPKHKAFHNYGKNGISVCEKWESSFDAFIEDMGPRPSSSHSVERIDGQKNYSPDNCKWATPKEQSNNTRRNHIVRIDGENMTLMQAVEKFGGKYHTVKWRIYQGQTIEEALRL